MSDNYLRRWKIRIDGLGTYETDGIRVRFEIKQATLGDTNTATIKLTNLHRGRAEAFCKDTTSEGRYASIEAGYASNSGLLFQGHVARPIYGRESPTDTLCQVLCTDGKTAISHAFVNKTLPPGSTPKDHVDEAVKSMSQFAVNLGTVGKNVDLSKPKYPRSVTLMGMARKIIDDVARAKGATWGVQNLALNILKPSDAIPGGAFVLNSQTGLIGMPTLTPDGVFVRTLINPQMKMDCLVYIDQSLIQSYLPKLDTAGNVAPQFQGQGIRLASIAADGIYRIVKIDVVADSRGDDWYMDMMVLRPGETTPVSIDYGNVGSVPSGQGGIGSR